MEHYFHTGEPLKWRKRPVKYVDKVHSYFGNDGQLVDTDDAKALAESLWLKVLDRHVPDASSKNDLFGSARSEPFHEAYLLKFIVFCRQGEFRIF